jgi:hypothetical protein
MLHEIVSNCFTATFDSRATQKVWLDAGSATGKLSRPAPRVVARFGFE